MTITIDGPSAAGKSTLAKTLARSLGALHLNSGAYYRSIALAEMRDPGTPFFPDVRFDNEGHVIVDGTPSEEAIRSPQVAALASAISADELTRSWVDRQLKDVAARTPRVVADGRDMGSTVFPDAEVKIWLTADAKERAHRRYLELKGEVDESDVLREVERRDNADRTRKASPLRRAKDAVTIDNTALTQQETAAKALRLISRHVSATAPTLF